jgi:hypothetical protein
MKNNLQTILNTVDVRKNIRETHGALKRRPGVALLVVLSVLVLMMVFIFGGVYFFHAWVGVMKLRTARVGQVGAEITEVLRNQMNLYAVKVHDYLRTRSDEDKAAAMGRWFSKAELDAKSTYTYEEIKEKFKTIGFDSVDKDLTGLGRLKRFDISILKEGRTYENDILIVCQTLVEIETEDGAWLLPIAENRWERTQKGGKSLEIQMGVTKIWNKNGIAITIPMQIEGTGKNFWVDNWVD